MDIKRYTELLYEKVQKDGYIASDIASKLIESISLSEKNIEENYLNNSKTRIPPWEKLTTEEMVEKAYSMIFDSTLEVKEPVYPLGNITSYDVPDPWNYIWNCDYTFTLLKLLPDSRKNLINFLNTAKVKYVTEGLDSTVLYRKEWLFKKDWTIIEMWAEKNNPYYIYCLSTRPDDEVYLMEEF